MKSRHIPKDVSKAIFRRSKGFCECCGAFSGNDRHHILEYHLGGPHIPANLVVLCPSCHRQIPKVLTEAQQKLLQTWHHQNNSGPNISSVSKLMTLIPVVDFGTILYENIRNILRVDNQNIITLSRQTEGFYLNIVMIDEGFSPKLLVLANKVIVNDGYEIITKSQSITVKHNGEMWFHVESDPIIKIRGKITYKGEPIIFTEEEGFVFRSVKLHYVGMPGHSDYAALAISADSLQIVAGPAVGY